MQMNTSMVAGQASETHGTASRGRATTRTYSGRLLDLATPHRWTPADIRITDIAHHLSQLCRFTGATREFYSVAQHAVLVSELLEDRHPKLLANRHPTLTPAFWMAGLLHDGAEAYVGDLPAPVKHGFMLDEYWTAEDQIQAAIDVRFLGDRAGALAAPPMRALIKAADELALHAEMRDLITGANKRHADVANAAGVKTIRPKMPHQAELAFLRRFHDLEALIAERQVA
jgi:5'-deoxynucleotidase YfbR-like HD superfamily hydrolase